MKCIIQVDETGNTVNHPITLSNFVQAFPDLDISSDTAPAGYAWFTRKEQNSVLNGTHATIKQKVVASYEKSSDGINYEDTFTIVDLTQPELDALYQELLGKKPFPSWTVDQNTFEYVSPSPRPNIAPDAGKYYIWDEPSLSWVQKSLPTANTGNPA